MMSTTDIINNLMIHIQTKLESGDTETSVLFMKAVNRLIALEKNLHALENQMEEIRTKDQPLNSLARQLCDLLLVDEDQKEKDNILFRCPVCFLTDEHLSDCILLNYRKALKESTNE